MNETVYQKVSPLAAEPVVSMSSQKPWYGSLWVFSVGSVVFWLLEFAYQYFVYDPGNLTSAWIRSQALAGTTLIASSLFSSVLFKCHPKLGVHWRLRRRLGVAGALLIVMHVTGAIVYSYHSNFAAIFFSWNPFLNPVIFGVAAYPLLIAVAVVSTDWMVRKLKKWWKVIQRLVYPIFVLTIFHTIYLGHEVMESLPGFVLYGLIVATILGEIYWLMKISAQRRFKNLGFYVGLFIILCSLVLWYIAFRTGTLPG